MITRRISNPVQIGKVTVGGSAPIVVQSMTKTDTRDVRSTVNQIKELDEEKFLDVCIAHAHIWQWENVDAFFYARKKAKGE